ncbi:Sterol uptake control protein 2 [Lachnellula arida]|uniref:Sterol uptake control protein 2 n=1 Tax=Lachnellula arida TaxID=1316785 RepID=A0A8T9B2V3_9HELO|nr:Sterol uptake control protein 2 [Lachnellula arida]
MDSGYRIEFRDLRDEFCMVRDGVISSVLNRDFLDGGWGLSTTAILGDGVGADISTTSPSDQQTNSGFKESSSCDSQQKVLRDGQIWSHDVIQNSSLFDEPRETALVESPPAEAAQRPRKGHRKSRQGCFNCKQRKIKCPETQPACINCTKKKLKCIYPAPKTLLALRGSAVYSSSPIASVNLQATPTKFTSIDLRLFHHFLLEAYPHLPVGNTSAWISEVPLIAHHNEYLMHAVLGMAASHLELITGADLKANAIHHRLLAIKGSNDAISEPRRTGSDGDALLASCYLLAFQSSYMTDGMQEFFCMIRGCGLLNAQLKNENLPMAFFLQEKDHFDYMQERLVDLPTIDSKSVEEAKRSLAACVPFLDSAICVQFHQSLVDTIESLKLSSLRSYFKFIMVYQYVIKLDNEDFKLFVDPGNLTAQVLVSHFLATHLIMAPILDREYGQRGRATPIRYHLDWIDSILDSLPERMTCLMQWPKAVADCVRGELQGKQAPGPGISILGKKEGLSARFVSNVT